MFTLEIPKILNHGWSGKFWCVRGDQRDYANLEWMDQSAKPTEQAMLDDELAAAKSWQIEQTKNEAQSRIYAAYPIWKQANCANGFYDESTTTAIKNGIQAIRTAEEAAEVAINALETVVAVQAFTW
jgi:hypothetical protein